MGYIYILSTIVLALGFLFVRKTEKEQSFIKWTCIFIVGLYAYNITLCMTLGLLHIPQYMWLLAIINTLIGGCLLYKPVIKKECQKYKTSKLEIIAFIAIIILFVVMFVKDLYIFKGDITHFIVDPAIHFRAAEHYSENHKLFVFDEDKTFYNFNIMQTGAYINDGIFMNVVNSITGLDKAYVFQIFESVTLFVSGLAFYACVIDKIKTKRGLIGSLCLFVLYMYGYPYNSWIYGFSYLSVGIALTVLMYPLVQMVFSDDKVSKLFVIPMIIMNGIGIILSYCLFIPPVFAAICIYVFLEELKDKDTKKYLKIFGKNTLIITGTLLLVTALGIGYLFIPSFIIEGQQNLVSAIQEEGGIYSEIYRNFIVFIPFLVIFASEIIEKIKTKDFKYRDVFSVIFIGYVVLLYIGWRFHKVSMYYMIKTYFILWAIIFEIAIDIINKYIDKKMFRIDAILLVAYFLVLYFGKISLESGIKYGLLIVLALFTVTPELLKDRVNFEKLRITGVTFIVIWTLFVGSWVWLKSGHILSEERKHALPNLVGMYYIENCEHRKSIDMLNTFTQGNLEITRYAKENLEDMTADNTLLITHDVNVTFWAISTLGYNGKEIDFRHVVNRTNQYDLEKAVNKDGIKYIIELSSNELGMMTNTKNTIEEIHSREDVELILSNDNGYIVKVK